MYDLLQFIDFYMRITNFIIDYLFILLFFLEGHIIRLDAKIQGKTIVKYSLENLSAT